MDSSHGRPTKHSIKKGRGQPVAESVGRSLQERLPPPQTPYSKDMVDEVHEAMRKHVEGPCDLGVYNEAEDQSRGEGATMLGGHAQAIRFPRFWHTWFSKQTPQRLATIDELVEERMEREVIRRFFRRLKHAAIAAVVAGAAGAHWFSEQIAWVVEKLPVLREVWKLITGAGKS
jgi:hypothetical protein